MESDEGDISVQRYNDSPVYPLNNKFNNALTKNTCMKKKLTFAILALAVGALVAKQSAPRLSGDYLEVRSCDVYTGPCVGNAEMGLSGREGILVWSVREGSWKGTALDG